MVQYSASDHSRGFILIAVLWVTMLLSIFALNFSTSSRLQGTQALNMEKMYQEEQLLQSALEYGYHQYLKYRENKGLVDQKEEIESITELEYDLWYPRYEPYTKDVGNTTIAIRLLNVGGKFNINNTKLHLLQDVLSKCGVENGTEMTAVSNSILDWMDKDSMKRAEGAEKDYYMKQDEPYLPKNENMESVEELLLVKGVTPEIYYGSDQHPGLKDLFNVYGQGEKMDINSASPQTFALIPGLSQDLIQGISTLRQDKRLTKLSELGSLIPQRYFSQVQDYYGLSQAKKIRVEAFLVLDKDQYGRSASKIYDIEE